MPADRRPALNASTGEEPARSTFDTGRRQLCVVAIYTAGGVVQVLRKAPDYAEPAPGALPVWQRAH